jgi:hypothetical protein
LTKLLKFVTSNILIVGIAGFVVSIAIRLIFDGGASQRDVLVDALTFLVGVNGIMTGSGHLFAGPQVAQAIGWQPSPFQWEVGLADVSFGVLGVMAGSYSRGFWLATIIAFSIFMLGDAVGHIRQMIVAHDFAPGNAGIYFWNDIILPIALIVLYATL